jgi:hypothetical protein
VQGSISPNFFVKQKVASAQRSAKKIAVQFHQQSSKDKIRSKFAKMCTPFAKCRLPKKGIESCARIFRAQMLFKLTPE